MPELPLSGISVSPVQDTCQPQPFGPACVATETCSVVPRGLYFVSVQKYVHWLPELWGNQSSARATELPATAEKRAITSIQRLTLPKVSTRGERSSGHRTAGRPASARKARCRSRPSLGRCSKLDDVEHGDHRGPPQHELVEIHRHRLARAGGGPADAVAGHGPGRAPERRTWRLVTVNSLRPPAVEGARAQRSSRGVTIRRQATCSCAPDRTDTPTWERKGPGRSAGTSARPPAARRRTPGRRGEKPRQVRCRGPRGRRRLDRPTRGRDRPAAPVRRGGGRRRRRGPEWRRAPAPPGRAGRQTAATSTTAPAAVAAECSLLTL